MSIREALLDRLGGGGGGYARDAACPQVWSRLKASRHLWHTTSPDRFQAIRHFGAICPNPQGLPESARWHTACGPDKYPLVRSISGVSLFDFTMIESLDKYKERCPSSSIYQFIPWDRRWTESVWIEIDREAVSAGLWSVEEVKSHWERGNVSRSFMPEIEAAHIGDLPSSAFLSAFRISPDRPQIEDIPLARSNNAG